MPETRCKPREKGCGDEVIRGSRKRRKTHRSSGRAFDSGRSRFRSQNEVRRIPQSRRNSSPQTCGHHDVVFVAIFQVHIAQADLSGSRLSGLITARSRQKLVQIARFGHARKQKRDFCFAPVRSARPAKLSYRTAFSYTPLRSRLRPGYRRRCQLALIFAGEFRTFSEPDLAVAFQSTWRGGIFRQVFANAIESDRAPEQSSPIRREPAAGLQAPRRWLQFAGKPEFAAQCHVTRLGEKGERETGSKTEAVFAIAARRSNLNSRSAVASSLAAGTGKYAIP